MADDGYKQNDKVEAKIKGWTKFYPGKITKKHSDGTYDILFNDGDRKSNILESQIRLQGERGTQGNHKNGKYRPGDRIEAKVSGWTKYYAGEITRVHSDNTYDIKFDDGERKSKVIERQIRLETSSSARSNSSSRDGSRVSSPRGKYEKHDRVEAKLKGWTKYYPGKISKINSDGTYDIKFDDGERKSNVKALYIREG